jgi:rubrerythrin
MKWTSLLFLTAFAAASAAAQRTPIQIQQALNDAVTRERQAIGRYEAFAVTAEAEGYGGIATLFHAASSSEAVHLRRFTALMDARGLAPPIEQARPVKAGSTRDNLNEAVLAEIAERDGAYREGIQACTSNHDAEAAKVFDETRDAEVEHANLCAEAGRKLEQMKDAKQYAVCEHCGYTTNLRLGFCPLCRRPMR